MATTPQFFWPYQSLTDPPNGATLGADLALAIEGTVSPISTSVVDHETRLDNAEGAWPSWAPTVTGMTQGDGSFSAVARRFGKTFDYDFMFKLGSTSAVAATVSFTLPYTPHSRYTAFNTRVGSGMLLDSSGAATRDVVGFWNGSAVEPYFLNATPTHQGITNLTPWTWAINDVIHVYGRLELA